ncbi:MAG TPA: hypothetical protein VN958_17115 [Chitinophagaceae bacterium]|nr:hypothetical protein [Chitinophagaceae bacterium]
MYITVWSKYLPVIRILLKRSVVSEQILDLNRIDFERLGSGRKAGYKFVIDFKKGSVNNLISNIPMAADLASVMLEDEATKGLLQKNDYQINLNTRFKLNILHFPRLPEISEDDSVMAEEAVESEHA